MDVRLAVDMDLTPTICVQPVIYNEPYRKVLVHVTQHTLMKGIELIVLVNSFLNQSLYSSMWKLSNNENNMH